MKQSSSAIAKAQLAFLLFLAPLAAHAQQRVDPAYPPYSLLAPQQQKICDVYNLRAKAIVADRETSAHLTPLQAAQYKSSYNPQKYAEMIHQIMGDGTFTDWFGQLVASPSQDHAVMLSFSFGCPRDKSLPNPSMPIASIGLQTVRDRRSYNPQLPGTDQVSFDQPTVKVLSALPGNSSAARVSGHIFPASPVLGPNLPNAYVGFNDHIATDINTNGGDPVAGDGMTFSAAFSKLVVLRPNP
jgi:hypothetical protein